MQTTDTRCLMPVNPNTSHELEVFYDALQFTLSMEGGLSRDPRDPGNAGGRATLYGITQKSYDHWRQKRGDPTQDIMKITHCEREALYYEEYFISSRCNLLPPKLAVALFDTAVHTGPSRAVKLLQKALGIAADGKFGSLTLQASIHQPLEKLLNHFLKERKNFYELLSQKKPALQRFLRGWRNRIELLQQKLQSDKE
jgi:lysozyme family protein